MSTSIAMLGAGHADLAGGPTPLITPGLIFWYDARVITGLSNDDSMVTWIDASGNGNTATLGTAPVYRTADLNSGPAVQGNGTSQHMLTGVAPSVAAGTMIAAFVATAPSDYLMGSQDPGERCYLATSSDGYGGGGVGGADYNSIEGTSSVTDGNPHILIVTYDGSDVALYLDGMLQDSQAQSDAPGTRNMVLLAADIEGSIIQHFSGDVGQLLYYNSEITDHEVRELSLYFADIYGITTGLVRDYRQAHKWGEMINMAPASDYITGVRVALDYGSNPRNGDIHAATDPYSTDAPAEFSDGSGSMSFDESASNYIDFQNEIYRSEISSGDMTISAWFNAASFETSDYVSIFKKGGGGSIAFALEVKSGSIRTWITTDAGNEIITTSVTMETGRWYHLMAVADGTNINLYLDGVAGTPNAYDGTLSWGSNRMMGIANNWIGGGAFFDGKIKDVKLWQRGITAAEITALVAENTSSDDYPDDPDNWWKLDSESVVDDGGSALAFDGTDDFVTIDYDVEFGEGDWAISFWLRGGSGASSAEYVFSMLNDTSGTNRWGFRFYGDIYSGPGGYILVHSDGAAAIPYELWTHVVINHNGSLQTYHDGIKKGDKADTTDFDFSKNFIRLGHSGDGTTGSHFFTGSLDNVKVWTRSLSAAEITALAAENQTSSDYPSDPDNHWSFDHGAQ